MIMTSMPWLTNIQAYLLKCTSIILLQPFICFGNSSVYHPSSPSDAIIKFKFTGKFKKATYIILSDDLRHKTLCSICGSNQVYHHTSVQQAYGKFQRAALTEVCHICRPVWRLVLVTFLQNHCCYFPV